jgi:hypothetical protein
MYGNPETTSGGNALKYYASVRLDVRKKETLGNDSTGEAPGMRVKVKVAKNKVGQAGRGGGGASRLDVCSHRRRHQCWKRDGRLLLHWPRAPAGSGFISGE